MGIDLAKNISKLFSPYLIAPLTILMVAIILSESLEIALFYSLIFFIISILPIVGYVLIQMKRGIILDIHVKDRLQRNKLYFIGLVTILLNLLLFYYLNAPKNLIAILLTLLVIGVLSYLINKKTKISLHVVTMAGMTVIAYTLINYRAGLLGLILTLITMWARVKMEAHTVREIVLGYIVGIVITFAALQYFIFN